jgi:type I restriction enzyme R subunit
MVGTGIVHPDVVSTLGARLARLDRELDEAQQREIAKHAKGAAVAKLAGDLIASIDPDAVRERAIAMHALPTGQEPSEPQLAAAEHERMSEALRPFHNPELRDAIVNIKRSLEQVIDEVSRDELLEASFDEAAREKARSLVSDFRRFVEDRKDEIEALQILYDRPHRAGLRYGQVKELATALQRPPLLLVDRAGERLWNAYEAVEPDKVKGKGGSALVDLVALVRHAILPEDPLVPVADVVEERYRRWLEEKKAAGVVFSTEQLKWLDAIKNHIAMSLAIEVEDFDSIPFNQMGGLGRAHQVFGGQLRPLIEELNQRLAA